MSADEPNDPRSHESDFAAIWSSDGVTRSLAATAVGLPANLPFLFSPSQRLGPYMVIRPIGKGGMGQVYEAEEIESGRRVAVKILSHGLGDGEERERFLREGQLAASLSHPNCVYVFGTTEIQGFPVIAMELAPAGTLKDLMDPGAPMPVSKAVDAILQVIAGLEAAAAIGILHRDIKPSNCFVDGDGRIMIGDFGLSIATLARESVTEAGIILGTPGFASPEQLRGEPLDLRSDIYSVGATIYYLLTGKTPFDHPNIRTMMTRAANETAPALTLSRPDIPGRLGSIVAKCLATKPADRYPDYAALAAALEPFRSASVTPAPLGRRFLAGFIDSYAAALPLMPFNIMMGSRLLDAEQRGEALVLILPSVVASLLYYSILEGRFGCAAGKAALNLRVIDESGHTPGFRRSLFRAIAFIVPAQVVVQGVSYVALRMFGGAVAATDNVTASITGLAVVAMTFIWLGVIFLPARRRNGYAAMHDRVSRTRVVLRPRAIEARQGARAKDVATHVAASGTARIGPYLVTDVSGPPAGGIGRARMVHGYDDRLRRGVWIELLPPGTPAVPVWRRDLNRPGRARWISGRRTTSECWDAYEGMEGKPLAAAIAGSQPWSRVRHWIADLAGEIAASLRDGSLPLLSYDRIWIANDDRARLLDWPPPSAREEPSPAEAEPQQFLYATAVGALRGIHPAVAADQPPLTPLPGNARTLLLALRDRTAGTPEAIAARTVALLRDVPAFPRRRRLLQLVVCSIVPVTMAVAVFSVLKTQLRARTSDPSGYTLKACLNQLTGLEKIGEAALTDSQRQQKELIEIYIAEHLREQADEMASYARAFPSMANLQKDYQTAERVIARQPQRSAEQLKKAEAVVQTVVANHTRALEKMNQPVVLWGLLGMIAGGAIAFVAAFGLPASFIARGGLTFRAFGAILVTADGSPASRLRALARAAIAWSPIVLWILVVRSTPSGEHSTVTAGVLYTLLVAIFVTGALWAWRHPSRGIQDRIAGTWIVPR